MQQQKVHDGKSIGPAPVARTADAPARLSELRLSAEGDLQALENEWRRLEKLPGNSLHQGFDWCRCWLQAHRSDFTVVRGRKAGHTLFLLPLEIRMENGVRVARLPGDRFNNINTGLFDARLQEPDTEELQNFAHALKLVLRQKADLIILDNIPLAWRGVRHPLAGLATIENQNRSFQLPLLPDFEATIGQLSARNRRKKFRSSNRKLEAIGGYDHVIASEQSEKHALLDLFFQQKGERLTSFGLPDVFQAQDARTFFHRLLDVPAEGSDVPLILHAIRLRGMHEGHIAAIAGLSRKGDHVLCQFSSIDESICAEASPGELLFWLTIERSCLEGASTFDFGIGDQLYKRSWCTQETVQHDILLPLTWRGALIRPYMVGITKVKAAVKRNPSLYAAIQRWRAGR